MKIKNKNVSIAKVISYVLNKIEFFLSSRSLNVWKTIWLNFRSLPFSQAIKFPISVYGGLKIVSLYGNIEIKAPIKTGMIKLGMKSPTDLVSPMRSILGNKGKIIFRGNATLYNGFIISIAFHKTLELGKNVNIGNNFVIHGGDDITIGDYTRMAYNTKILNSDFHYSVDRNTGKIGVRHKPIIIGPNNWITSEVRVMKGTQTPPWTIVTGCALLNKDYTKTINPYSVLGGQPAKLIKEGQQRIFNVKNEEMLNDYFRINYQAESYTLDENVVIDDFCR